MHGSCDACMHACACPGNAAAAPALVPLGCWRPRPGNASAARTPALWDTMLNILMNMPMLQTTLIADGLVLRSEGSARPGQVVVHANELEYNASGVSTGDIVRYPAQPW